MLLRAIILALCASAVLAGTPGSTERGQWCEAERARCAAVSKQPGFLGGALNYCNTPSDGPECVSVCDLRFGKKSPCMTREAP